MSKVLELWTALAGERRGSHLSMQSDGLYSTNFVTRVRRAEVVLSKCWAEVTASMYPTRKDDSIWRNPTSTPQEDAVEVF